MSEKVKVAELPTTVGVDLAALILKVLSRYPGEFTLFRELLQNADDARSDTVEICFQTAKSNPRSSDAERIVQWIFKNNGAEFTDEDWIRLTKIGMGNTNPTKVGAFGVGFYSIFSVTDGPVVLSGRVGREFYWDETRQLRVRPATLPSDGTTSPWTIVKTPLRDPGPMPKTIDFMRFLATSITFMEHLKHVNVFLDELPIGRISKLPGFVKSVDLPIELKHSGSLKMMVMKGLQRHQFTIQAEISTDALESPDMRSVALATGDPRNFHTTKLDLTVFTAEVNVKADEKFSRELFRYTYKELPSQLKYSLVYTGKHEYDRNLVNPKNQPLLSVFQGLRADLEGASHSRIFIGHPTSQTTGIGGHMASSFIPTVERESIDLVNKNISAWNRELLYVGGFLARTVYEIELSAIRTSWEQATGSNTSKFRDLCDPFIHVLKFFTFHESMPSSNVAQVLQESFYDCSSSPLRFLSSVGVRDSSVIRSFDLLCSKFLRNVPMLSPEITKVAQRIIEKLPIGHKIRAITLKDVLQELSERTLDQGEFVAYLEWTFHDSTRDMAELLEVAKFLCAGRMIKLSSISSFIDSNGTGAYIPLDGPMPTSLIPVEITKSFTPIKLTRLGWREFTIADWLRHISQEEIRSANPKHDFLQSVDWAERVLLTVSVAWSSSEEIRSLARSTFANKKCIPVMRKLYGPEETYLPSDGFPAFNDLDLKLIQIPSSFITTKEMERLLVALGVRQHLAPQLLLKHVVETGKWETSVLIKYLVNVADTLSPTDIAELKPYDAFAGVGAQSGANKKRFRADELYPPTSTFQQLQLLTIEWKGSSEWRDTSPEADLMYRLGLRRYPPLKEVITLCSQDTAVGRYAFTYLCANLRSIYSGYSPDDFRDIAFIPAETTTNSRLEKLENVFLENYWKTLDLAVIRHKDLENTLEALGVQRHPPSSLLLKLLGEKPPANEEIARQWFEILSKHVSRFSQKELESLSQLLIVPKTISKERKWLAPIQCYLGKSTKHDLYSKLFHFVDFGAGAIEFLRACGAKNEPSEEDVAEFLVDNHDEFYCVAKYDQYLQELRDLAARQTRISNKTICRMRMKPVLLGARREKTTNPDGWKNVPSLWKPGEIVIVNDIHTYQLFGDAIVAAPQNMLPELEAFYDLLGCKLLTNVVRSECDPSDVQDDPGQCSRYSNLIKERLRLFLHHRPGTSVSRSSDDITVRVCEHLSVSKTLTVGNKKISKDGSVWATAEEEQETILVWISRDAKQDMYELAVSLCRVVLGAVHLNDALLLTSILSEDLDVLKGRGYEVDQVLQSPQHPNLTDATKLCSSATMEISNPSTDPQCPATDGRVDSMPGDAESLTSHCPGPEGNEATIGASASSSTFATATRYISNAVCAFLPGTATPATPHQVMRQSYIESIVKQSIQACNSHSSSPRPHRDADVIKFLKNGYCNVSAPLENLRYIGSTGNVDIHADPATLDVDKFMEYKKDQLTHFVRIITRITRIYDLPKGSVRIFFDTTAGCIAFNNKGTGILYLNLRYFEEWHYQDVKRCKSQRALSSWFLTVAHEIAHNLVDQHNSEHEFWFSAISEAYMDALFHKS